MTNLHEQLVVAEGRVREMEAILERGTVELEELKEEHRRTQASLEIKNQEVRSGLVPLDGSASTASMHCWLGNPSSSRFGSPICLLGASLVLVLSSRSECG